MPRIVTSRAKRLEATLASVQARAVTLLDRGRPGRFVLETVQAARAVAHGFRGEKISLRASALTYITMLSLVPLLAVVFAIVRGVGRENLRRMVHEFVFGNLAPGVREQIGGYLDEFIARASAGAMGGVGGLFLLVSALGLFHNIERSLDEIWGVARPRPLVKRVVIYWCVLTMGPVALGLSLLATSMARSRVEASLPRGVVALVPWATSVALFSFLYLAVPSARVRFRAGLAGAFVAASAWEVAKHLYAFFASHAFRYNAIYGSLGAVPLFLLWVYVSWVLVLFGARLAYALQYALVAAPPPKADDARSRQVICARIALQAATAFLQGVEPPTLGSLAHSLSLDADFVSDAVDVLKRGGLLAEAVSGGLVPARAPNQISLVDIAEVAHGTLSDHSDEVPSKEATTRALSELFAEADRRGRETLSQFDLASLAQPPVRPRPADEAKRSGNSNT